MNGRRRLPRSMAAGLSRAAASLSSPRFVSGSPRSELPSHVQPAAVPAAAAAAPAPPPAAAPPPPPGAAGRPVSAATRGRGSRACPEGAALFRLRPKPGSVPALPRRGRRRRGAGDGGRGRGGVGRRSGALGAMRGGGPLWGGRAAGCWQCEPALRRWNGTGQSEGMKGCCRQPPLGSAPSFPARGGVRGWRGPWIMENALFSQKYTRG